MACEPAPDPEPHPTQPSVPERAGQRARTCVPGGRCRQVLGRTSRSFRRSIRVPSPVLALALAACSLGLAACTAGSAHPGAGSAARAGAPAGSSVTRPPTTTTSTTAVPSSTTATTTAPAHRPPRRRPPPRGSRPCRYPTPWRPSPRPVSSGEGVWTAAGRTVEGVPAVYETTLVPPGGSAAAGLAWMDTRLLAAQLYSGSKSPGGGPYPLTAPVEPTQAASLVAAFNGGFLMKDAQGGYYTRGTRHLPPRRRCRIAGDLRRRLRDRRRLGQRRHHDPRRRRRAPEPRPPRRGRPAHGRGGERRLARLGRHLRGDLVLVVGAGPGEPVALERRHHRRRGARVRRRTGPEPDPAG